MICFSLTGLHTAEQLKKGLNEQGYSVTPRKEKQISGRFHRGERRYLDRKQVSFGRRDYFCRRMRDCRAEHRALCEGQEIRSGSPGDRRVRKICDFSSFRPSRRRQRPGGEGRAGSPCPAGGNDGDRSSSPVCRRRVREKKITALSSI